MVKTGVLFCEASRLWYPVINYVPVMLTFATGLVEGFARDNSELLARHPGYAAPTLDPCPGERSVQATFTEEWSGLGEDELTFVYTDDELLKLRRAILNVRFYCMSFFKRPPHVRCKLMSKDS